MKDRSYRIERQGLQRGDVLVAIVGDHRVAKGERITLASTTNAGFRGIECSGYKADGTFVHGMSLGHFTPDWMF